VKDSFDAQDWISMAEAARLRGVSRNAIANLVRRNKLKSYEIGGRKLVSASEVSAFQPQPIGRPPKKKSAKKAAKQAKNTPRQQP
jgi:excisionase family DNA binding protein